MAERQDQADETDEAEPVGRVHLSQGIAEFGFRQKAERVGRFRELDGMTDLFFARLGHDEREVARGHARSFDFDDGRAILVGRDGAEIDFLFGLLVEQLHGDFGARGQLRNGLFFGDRRDLVLRQQGNGVVLRLDLAVGGFDFVGGDAVDRESDGAPGQDDDGHRGGGDHDFEGFVARFVDADHVLSEEVERGGAGDRHGPPGLPGVGDGGIQLDSGEIGVASQPEAHDVLARGDAADWPCEDVIEHQGGDGEFREESAHRFLDDAIDSAADEEGGAFDVDGADGIAEDHDGEDEPGRRRADGSFDDAADVVCRAGEIAEDDGGGLPVGDEGEHHAADDDDLGRALGLALDGGGLRIRHGSFLG